MGLGNGALRKVFEEAFCEIANRHKAPEIEVGFYPFAGLNNYIQIRNRKAYVKLSDILREAPRSVHRALAYILVAKLFRKTPAEKFEEVYRSYISTPSVMRTMERVQRQRGYKRIIGTRGRVRDLQKSFHKLNRLYFNGGLKMPQLTWSARRTHRILGHLDRVHNTLVISRTLDDARIPQFFFEYILYHEMLHLKHAPRRKGYRCYNHTPEFLREEQQFKHFDEAQKWLDRIASRR
jgi:hypothetical protein